MAQRYDQDAILGYVEGELSQQQRQAFEQLLAADPALRQLVNDLMADREALRQMSLRDSAPVGIVDAAIGHLERRMLLGGDDLADAQPRRAGPIPISTTPHARLSRTRWMVGIAVAAILLISGGIIFQTLVLPQGQTQPQLADSRQHPLLEEPSIEPNIEPSDTDTLADAAISSREAAAPLTAGAALSKSAATDATAAAPEAESEPAPALTTTPPAQTLAMAPRQDSIAAAPTPPAESKGAAANMQAELRAADRADDTNRLSAAQQLVMTRRAQQSQPQIASPALNQNSMPEARIEVTTAKTNDTQRQVILWALSNQAQVIETPTPPSASASMSLLPPPDDTLAKKHARGAQPANSFFAAKAAPAPQPRQQTLIVQMDESQVKQLADFLNTQSNQRATIVRAQPEAQPEGFMDLGLAQAKDEAEEETKPAPAATSSLAAKPANVPTPAFAVRPGTAHAPAPAALAETAPAPSPAAKAEAAPPGPAAPTAEHAASEPSAPSADLDIDWAQVLNNQLPLTPVQHFASANRTQLPEPGRRVNVVVELIEETPPLPPASPAPSGEPPAEPTGSK